MADVTSGEVLGAVATIVAALLTILFRPEFFTSLSYRLRGSRSLSWRAIEKGLQRLEAQMRDSGFEPDLILTVAGSGGMMANWLYKSRDRSIPTYLILQEPKDQRWADPPAGHEAIEGNQWVIHIPDHVGKIRNGAKILILDSGYATGETVLAIREYLTENLQDPDVKSACLVYVRNPGRMPIGLDHFAYEFKSSDFRYPWGKAS